jgi:hypothetical protein
VRQSAEGLPAKRSDFCHRSVAGKPRQMIY